MAVGEVITVNRFRRAGFIAIAFVACVSTQHSPPPLFEFHNNFWLNLHHFMRAVARGVPAGADLNAEERAIWHDAVAFYRKNYADRDVLQDAGMVEIKNALRSYETNDSLAGAPIDPETRTTLERVAAIYRKVWWPAHRASNQSWIDDAKPLVSAYGRPLSARIAASYGVTWPNDPIPVDLSVQAGPVGAYTTDPPTHTTIASTNPAIRGFAALEILFHESSHAWGRTLHASIAKASAVHTKTVPPQLWHAVLFYNSGELTRRILQEYGVNGYVEYAVKNDVYRNLCGEGCRDRVAAAWDRRLSGAASMDEALDALVASWPETVR